VFFMLLQNAGSETTRNLITTGTLALLEHPRADGDRGERFRHAPRCDRGTSPFHDSGDRFHRTANVDTEAVRRSDDGEQRAHGLHIADRDERAFTDPDSIDVLRTPE